MWFHKHSWEIVSSVYRPPVDRARKSASMSESGLLKSTSGFTSVLQRCEGCGELRAMQALGKHVVAEDLT